MEREESTLAVDQPVRKATLRNKNGSPTRPRTVFDRMEGQKRLHQSASYVDRRPVTSSSAGLTASQGFPSEEEEHTRDFGVQAAPLPWARYFFPEDLNGGAERTTMPFYKHFDVIREENQVDPSGRYLGAIPDWAADRYIMLHYAEFANDPEGAAQRGSKDFAPWDVSIYDDQQFNEKTRLEVLEFLIHTSRFTPRSPADQEPLFELQKAIVGYCVKQLDLAYKQAEILFERKMDSHKQTLQADLERRKAEVHMEERDKQEELLREVDRLRSELMAQKEKYADALLSHQAVVEDLQKDVKKLEQRWEEELARQARVEADVRELRGTVEGLDKLGIKDKKDAERLHNETIKEIAKVTVVNDDPIAEHANVIARSCLRWVLRALTGMDRAFEQGGPARSVSELAPTFKYLFDDVKTDEELEAAMATALQRVRQWRPNNSVAIWKTKVKPRGPGAIAGDDGSRGTVLEGIAGTEDIRMQVVGGLLDPVSAPTHFKVVATSRIWDGPALGGGRVYVLPVFPRRYHGGGRTLNPTCGVLALGLERPPVESDRQGFFDPKPIGWGEGPDAQMLAVYGGLCTALGTGMEELQREKARATTRAKQAAAKDRFADAGAVVDEEEPTQWWEFIYKIGAIRSRERFICRTLEETAVPARSLKELRQMACPSDTVVACVAAALLAVGDMDVAGVLPGGDGGEEVIRMPYESPEAMKALWAVVKPKLEQPAQLIARMRKRAMIDPDDDGPEARLVKARFHAAVATVHVIPQEDATAASVAGGILREWTILQGKLEEYTRLKAAKEQEGYSHYSLAADTGELYNQDMTLSAGSMAILARAVGGEVLEDAAQ